MSDRKRIAIVGVGLIGGSLALQLNEKGLASRLIGVDSNRDHQKKALELGLVDEIMDLDEAIDNSDVVILAIPVDALVKLMPQVLDKINKQVLIDMGSTKSELMRIANDHTKRGR
ncbi:MAG TPA: prephenate dehydrogenase/arogenate dehydrogenase family protein, partial [Chitinophagaceae bacterium]|nr:prephenate dehydrogenase/arogenate dehydrogenase family protein [Chitinophagaceae bacterium]